MTLPWRAMANPQGTAGAGSLCVHIGLPLWIFTATTLLPIASTAALLATPIAVPPVVLNPQCGC